MIGRICNKLKFNFFIFPFKITIFALYFLQRNPILMKHFFASIPFLFSLFCFEINAQITLPVRSYNKIGLGEFNFNENTSTQSMGGLSTIYLSPTGTEVNFFNPAANSNLEDTAFNLSGSFDYILYKNKAENSSYNQFNFDRISLGLPLGKKIKAGIGFRQNSFLNDESVVKNDVVNTINLINTEKNDVNFTNSILDSKINNGGLNNFQSFISYQVSDRFSLGFKAENISGNFIQDDKKDNDNEFIEYKPVSNTTTTTPVGANTMTVTIGVDDIVRRTTITKNKTTNKINQNVFTLGGYYKIPISKKGSFLIGATYGIGTKIKQEIHKESSVDSTYSVRRDSLTKIDLSNTTEIDTIKNSSRFLKQSEISKDYSNKYSNYSIASSSYQKNSITPTQNFSFAFGYEMQDKWMLGADFQWNGMGVFGNLIDSQITYQNRYRIALGGWWLPNKNGYKSYFQKVVYKGGVFFEQTPYLVDGQSIKDMGATIGFGLPVGKKTKSSINLGFEYIRRGTSNGLATQQDYFGLRLGLNFVNKWFNERLID